MDAATNLIFTEFYRFLIGQLPIADFAEWIYHSDSICSTIGRDWDSQLLAFDYRAPNAELTLRRLIERIYRDLRPGVETDMLFWRLDVTDAAAAFLNGSQPFIDGASRLCYLCEFMHDDCWYDADFSVFCIIADQSDLIPPTSTQAHLSKEALEQVTCEESEFEALYRSKAVAAAQRLIERFRLR
jgi:hypothetical protein